MLGAITALDVALVSSIAALTAAVLTPVVTWIATSARNRHERWIRIYDDRRESYFTILSVSYRSLEVIDEFLRAIEMDEPGVIDLPGEPTEPDHVYQARVGLFAAPELARELGEFEEVRLRALGAMIVEPKSLVTPEGRAAVVATVGPIRDDLEKRAERIRVAIHDDLLQ